MDYTGLELDTVPGFFEHVENPRILQDSGLFDQLNERHHVNLVQETF